MRHRNLLESGADVRVNLKVNINSQLLWHAFLLNLLLCSHLCASCGGAFTVVFFEHSGGERSCCSGSVTPCFFHLDSALRAGVLSA